MQLGHFEVGLDVRDIERSLAFYEKLGFRVVEGDVGRRFVTIQNGNCQLSLYQGHLDPPETQLIFWNGDVEAIASALQQRSLTFERGPAKHDDGGTAALLRDPDGHPIYLVNMPAQTAA